MALLHGPRQPGTSIGISKVPDGSALARAIDLAREYDTKILVEDAVREPRELECGVLGNEEPAASVPGEIVPAGEFYDYGAKYLDDRSRTIVPAELPQELADRIRHLAVEAFRAVDGAGMARVDFLLEGPTGRLFLNEVNTIPGFTTISMFAKMWAASGVSYEALLDRLITLALERHASKQRLRRTAAAGAPRAGE